MLPSPCPPPSFPFLLSLPPSLFSDLPNLLEFLEWQLVLEGGHYSSPLLLSTSLYEELCPCKAWDVDEPSIAVWEGRAGTMVK